MHKNLSLSSLVVDANAPRFSFPFLPQHVQRKIAARWQEWIPWVLIDLLRRERDAASRSACGAAYIGRTKAASSGESGTCRW